MSDDAGLSLLNELCGEQLSAVTFVQDYLQLWFNGPGINVTNPLTVDTGEAVVKSAGPMGFTNVDRTG